MMNLENLYKATEFTGDTVFRHIASTHALNTIKHFSKNNYEHFQIVDFDTLTGTARYKGGFYTEMIRKTGEEQPTQWARGRGWALYGSTVCLRETENIQFLDIAQEIAGNIINNPDMPDDKIADEGLNINKDAQPLIHVMLPQAMQWGNIRKNSIVYADYYYLECLTKYKLLTK